MYIIFDIYVISCWTTFPMSVLYRKFWELDNIDICLYMHICNI
jgi:hypothetical protein